MAIKFEAKHFASPSIEWLMALRKEQEQKFSWEQGSDHWKVGINNETFDFYCGLGHREFVSKYAKAQMINKYGKRFLSQTSGLAKYRAIDWLAQTLPIPPSLDDVLHCLLSDVYATEMSFQDWCDEFGYNTDSRKALKTYLACQENTAKLRKAGIDISAEQERLANY